MRPGERKKVASIDGIRVALFAAATATYVANVVLGSGVALRLFSTASFRWVHHAVYVVTCVLSAAAVSTVLWTDSVAGWVLLPAALPLAALPFAGSASGRHVVVALLAAPFFIASLIVSWR